MKASKLNTTKIQSTPAGEFTTDQAVHMLKTEQHVTGLVMYSLNPSTRKENPGGLL